MAFVMRTSLALSVGLALQFVSFTGARRIAQSGQSKPSDEDEIETPEGPEIDDSQCMCKTGTRAVNLAGWGPYPKTNFQLQGPDGGKCTTPCDKCIRVYG